MSPHSCLTSDGTAIFCLFRRGSDHDETLFDVPVVQEDEAE